MDLLSPFCELRVGNTQIRNFFHAAEILLSRKQPADLADFTLKQSLDIGLEKDAEIEIWLGYKPDQAWRVFSGYITEPRSPQFIAKDDAVKLFRTRIVQTFQNVSPQDVLRAALAKAGISNFVLAGGDLPRKPHFAAAGENVSELVERINATWGVDYDHYFDADRRFHWDAPEPKSGEIYTYEYGENIIELDFGTDREPFGYRRFGPTTGLGRLVTVLSPFVGHSQEIEIVWPKVGNRRFITETVRHFINEHGSWRTELFFREIGGADA